MFGWISARIQDVRIARAFVGFERKAHERHLAEAGQRFSTSDQEFEVDRRMAASIKEAVTRFDEPANEIQRELTYISDLLRMKREHLGLFLRTYKNELDTLFAERESLIAKRRELSKRKSRAHDDLSSARRSIDAWHAKSKRGLFGNAGQKLPKHSPFGQSFGDLDGYKRDRDSAASEISTCEGEIASLSFRIGAIDDHITVVKAARQHMFALQEQGFQRLGLEPEIEKMVAQKEAKETDLSVIKSEKSIFLAEAKRRTGVADLELEIQRVNTEKADFLHSFDTVTAREIRRAEHRRQCLQERHG